MAAPPDAEDDVAVGGEVLPLFDHLGELERRLGGLRPALFLDFDGTLAPIVDDPAAAAMGPGMREALEMAAGRLTVAVVSGRDRLDVASRVGLGHLYYAGSHGLDIAGPGGAYQHEAAIAAVPALDALERRLREVLEEIPGAFTERKRFTLAVHYRQSNGSDSGRVKEAVRREAACHEELRITGGKEVCEVRPAVDWDKGDAVVWLLGALGLREGEVVPLYVGDDLTDEDAFRALRAREHGIGVLVGDPRELSPSRETLADYFVRDLGEVEALLRRVAR